MSEDPMLITVAALPAALERRGIACSPRQARSFMNRLPWFVSPLNGVQVITPEALDQALLEGAEESTRRWALDEQRKGRRRKGRPIEEASPEIEGKPLSKAAQRRAMRNIA